MKGLVTAVVLTSSTIAAAAGSGAISTTAPSAVAGSAVFAAKSCPPGQYKKGNCYAFTSAGTYTLTVPGTPVTLRATVTKRSVGSEVTLARVTVSHPHAGGYTFKVFARGSMPSLSLTRNGLIEQYVTGANTWRVVTQIVRPGIYEVTYS